MTRFLVSLFSSLIVFRVGFSFCSLSVFRHLLSVSFQQLSEPVLRHAWPPLFLGVPTGWGSVPTAYEDISESDGEREIAGEVPEAIQEFLVTGEWKNPRPSSPRNGVIVWILFCLYRPDLPFEARVARYQPKDQFLCSHVISEMKSRWKSEYHWIYRIVEDGNHHRLRKIWYLVRQKRSWRGM